MAVLKPKAGSSPRVPRGLSGDLVANEKSGSFIFIERAAREGRRVSTQGLSDDAVRALILGDRKAE